MLVARTIGFNESDASRPSRPRTSSTCPTARPGPLRPGAHGDVRRVAAGRCRRCAASTSTCYAERGALHRRRVGLGQERHLARRHRPAARDRAGRGLDPARRTSRWLGADAETLRRLRGQDVGIIFQDPTTTLNPVLPVGRQVIEGQVAHGRLRRSAMRRARAVELLREVDIAGPGRPRRPSIRTSSPAACASAR